MVHFSATQKRSLLLLAMASVCACSTSVDRGTSRQPTKQQVTTGNVTGSGGSNTTTPGSGGNATKVSPGSGGAGTLVIPPGGPGPTALRRLTDVEYKNTVRDLLKLSTSTDLPLLPETRVDGWDNFSSALTVSAAILPQYRKIARSLAGTADVGVLAPCTPPAVEAECVSAFIGQFGKNAFRRPLTAPEVASYQKIFGVARTDGTYDESIRLVVEAMLYSPKLLYRSELGVSVGGGRQQLTQHEVAGELAYLLTASTPDSALLAAADAGNLATPAGIETEARRLLTLPQAKAPLQHFVMEWFALDGKGGITKDPATYPEYNSALAASANEGVTRFIDAVLWERGGTLHDLFSASYAFVNSDLAPLYGVANPGPTLTKVELNPAERSGFLTLIGNLAIHSKPTDSFPVGRGRFIRENLLCLPMPPPPMDLMVKPPPLDPTLTTRERYARHATDAKCAGCHSLMDPIGFGLENYDGIGRYRTTENGKPIDPSGSILGTSDLDGPYANGAELLKRLASGATTTACAAIQATRFSYGRSETDTDRMLAANLSAQFAQGSIDVREILVAIAKSESFQFRTAVP